MSINTREIVKKTLVIVTLVLLYVVFVKYIFPVTWPIIIGFIIAKIISPVVNFLKKHLKIADGFASAIVLTVVSGIVCGILVLFGVGIYNFLQGVIVNREHYETLVYDYCEDVFYEMEETFSLKHGIIMEKSKDMLTNTMDNMADTIVAKTMGSSAGMIKGIINIFIAAVVLYACTVLLAKEMDGISEKMMKTAVGTTALTVYDNVKKVILAYAKSQLVIMVINAVICSVTLLLLKVPNGLVIGIIVGLLDALPMIGVGVLFIPWSIVCLLLGKYFMAAVLFGIFVSCSLVREFLEPKLMGDKIGIHPVATLGAIFVGYNLFGIVGFILGPVGFIIIKNLWDIYACEEK